MVSVTSGRVLATFDDQDTSRRALRMRVIAEEAGARLQVPSRTWEASGSKRERRLFILSIAM
jgi:hypothetical protein